MSKQNYDQLLDTYVDELPKEITPPRDIWAGIDHAIELRAAERKRNNNKFRYAAAIAACMIGSTWLFTSSNNFNDSGPREISLSMLAHDIDEGFKMQKASMLAAYEGQPALTSTWQDQLHELESARSDIWHALKKSPNNTYLVQILVEIQQQQLDLIKNVHSRPIRDVSHL